MSDEKLNDLDLRDVELAVRLYGRINYLLKNDGYAATFHEHLAKFHQRVVSGEEKIDV